MFFDLGIVNNYFIVCNECEDQFVWGNLVGCYSCIIFCEIFECLKCGVFVFYFFKSV